MDLRIATIAERPAMKSRFVNEETEPWPAFMNEDPIGLLYYSDVRIAHPEYGLIAYDADAPDQAVARAFCVPFAWDGDPALGELPADGWDGVIWRSARDRQIGQKPNLVSALEITVPTDLQGTGLSGKMLAAMRDNVKVSGSRTWSPRYGRTASTWSLTCPSRSTRRWSARTACPRIHGCVFTSGPAAGSSAPASARWSSPAR
jgi:hypothetical protein